ncbi:MULTISPECIES: DUF6087 family protein [unclassified Streptomyces]|uniref:DUF6087 family protein n=1 Tax=unclassified Streptomyces TaxID=2593676 RepID=UPI000DC7826F|nr:MULTISPECIES: DUF6087 family protein [unclassified Streptomyces]AWZ08360.1 hypothetical protein DRB89_31490 [Streptomyces sp. ICC4]AWZ15914.1 hypothetical protein DRB96_30765 [Streptomyces sp. ICC1]
MNDEPFERWFARRQARLRQPGQLRAITLGVGPQRAAHIDPDAPRMIVEWDGFDWQAVMVVDNYAAACLVLTPSEGRAADQTETTGPVTGRNPLAPGTGRHRKPRP